MSITRTNTKTGSFGSGGSLSTSFAVSGSNNILFLATVDVASQTITPTYAGQSMTQIGSEVQGSNYMQLWYIVNPTSGSNTLAYTRVDSGAFSYYAVQYSDVFQTTPIDATDSKTAQTGATVTGSVTTARLYEWALFCVQSANSQTASTNATLVGAAGLGLVVYDNQTYGNIPTGAFSMAATQSSGSYAYYMASFKPKSLATSLTEAVTLTEGGSTNAGITISQTESITLADRSRVNYGFSTQSKNSNSWSNQNKS